MTIRRASVILPCRSLEDFPTHLTGQGAAELLAAATALWHPSLIHRARALPGQHSTDELPDPTEMDGELLVIPSASRERMAQDWCDRFRATAPKNPPPVDASASRRETIAALLVAASIDSKQVAAESADDFLALGFTYLQVELLTRSLRYTSVLDTDQFTSAVVAAADAAVSGNHVTKREELSRAFDLLADARNHVYSVDFYMIDITLLADTTLGETLRAKLAAGSPTNLLVTGEQIERIATEHPATLAELKRGLEAGTACVVGGMQRGGVWAGQSPESVLDELQAGQQTARRLLDREYEVFGQFEADFSPLLPALLKNLGFRGALHTAFDGGPLPRADQRKTNWGEGEDSKIEALSAIPLDASRPETWLKLAERIGDSIAHDHVATILLAGWPGAECEYFDDLRRAARFGSVLGKLMTLDAYFRDTREPDNWTNFYPREYANQPGDGLGANAISSRVHAYRKSVHDVQQRLGANLAAIAGFSTLSAAEAAAANLVVVNPWNVAVSQLVGVSAIDTGSAGDSKRAAERLFLPEVPGCGFATVASASAIPANTMANGLTLRNEVLELTVSQKTGGIQSLRTHRDRNTRVSQRLVFHHQMDGEPPESHMVADKVEITRNESLVGEITSHGRVLGAGGDVLTQFTQRVRAVRGLPAMIVDVELAPQHLPAGDIWKSYFASRLAWSEAALSIRRGKQWSGRETTRECIESSEWIEIDDGIGRVTCFMLGLPFHRMASQQWLDTLLLVAEEEGRRFKFAIAIDQSYPTHACLALMTACDPYLCTALEPPTSQRGWFLHVGAKNVLCTHIEPLSEPAGGVRLRLLETEGRQTRTSLSAFYPFRSAWISDFRGNRTDVLSVSDGRPEIDIGPYGWVQIDAEW
jgi:alpha-mannosidase